MKTFTTTHKFLTTTLIAGALLVGAGLGTAQADMDVKVYPGTMCDLYSTNKAPNNRTNADKNTKRAGTKKRAFTKRAGTRKRAFTKRAGTRKRAFTKRAETKKRAFTETGSSASPVLYEHDGSISNWKNDVVATVRCPIIRDTTTNSDGLYSVVVSYADNHDRIDPLCYVFSRSLKDNTISRRTYGTIQKRKLEYGASRIAGPNTSDASMFYTLYCAIPPQQGKSPFSRLLNYKVVEGDD